MKVIQVDIKPMVTVLYNEWQNETVDDNRKPLNRKENLERMKNKIISVISETFNSEYVNKISINKKDRSANIELVDNIELQKIYEACEKLDKKDLSAYYNII